ncbi:MAG: glycosyltransferase family 39 protein [Nitrospirota bacterium]
MIELFWLLTIICAAFGLGRRLVKCVKIQPPSLLEEFVLNVGIGLGLLSLIMLGLGFSRLFYPVVAYTLIILLDILFIYELKGIIPRVKFINFKKLDKVTIVLLIIFGLCTFFNFLKAYIPPMTSDVLLYHLALPGYFIEFHKIYDVSKIFANSEVPLLLEMLYTLGMLVRNDLVAQLILSFYGFLGTLSIVLILRKFSDFRIALLGAILYSSLPSIIVYSGTCMNDLGLAFYIILAVYTFSGWLEFSKKGWLIISAVTCGFAIGTKYWGGITLTLLPLTIIFIKMTKKEIRLNFTSIFKYNLIFGLLFLLVFSPWMIKAYIHTNNPVSPFILPGVNASNCNPFIENVWNSSLKGFQLGIVGFLDMIRNFKMYYQDDPYRLINGLLYFNIQFFPLLFLILFSIPGFKKNPIGINFILIFSLIHLLIGSKFAFMSDRYFFVPLSPVLCVLAAYGAGKILEKGKLHKQICVIVLIGLICGWWAYAYAFLTAKGWSHRALPVIFGIESRDSFLRKNLDFYSMADYINTHLSISDKMLSINETQSYYFKVQFVHSHTSVEGTIVHTSSNINEILSSLKKNNIHYIFINRNQYFTEHRYPTILWNEEILNKYFDLLHTNGVCYLYKIKD